MEISYLTRWMHGFSAAVVLGFSGLSSPAVAQDYRTYVSTGTISGIDTLGLFGAKGVDLNGASYNLNAVVDYSLLSSSPYTFKDGSGSNREIEYENGVRYCCSSNNNFSVYLSVNGKSINLTNYFESLGQNKTFDYVDFFNRVDEISGKIVQNYNYGHVNSGYSGSGLNADIYITTYRDNLGNSKNSDAGIRLSSNSNEIFKFVLTGDYGQILSGIVLPTSAVPEPETWAMMLAGMGMVGLLARRRQRVAKA